MSRLAIALLALLMFAAAPARAWCEASCFATAHSESSTPHCPTHEPSHDGTQIAGANSSECPTIEAARPVRSTPASQPAAAVPFVVFALDTPRGLSAPRRAATPPARHPLSVPLRI